MGRAGRGGPSCSAARWGAGWPRPCAADQHRVPRGRPAGRRRDQLTGVAGRGGWAGLGGRAGWNAEPGREPGDSGRPVSASRVQANQGSAGTTSATGWSAAIVPRARASAQAKSGSRLIPSPCSTAATTARRSGATRRRSPLNGRPERRLPEPSGHGQLGAVGHPGPPGQPRPELLEGRRARRRHQPGAPTRANRLRPMGEEARDRRPGGGAGHRHVELALLEQVEQLGVGPEPGHERRVGRAEPGHTAEEKNSADDPKRRVGGGAADRLRLRGRPARAPVGRASRPPGRAARGPCGWARRPRGSG